MTELGLVINLGLKSVRAIAFDKAGRKLATASRPIQTFLRDSWIEQDAHEWWEKTVESTREALGTLGRRASTAFVTVSASAACLIPVDESGKALRRAIMVSDRRALAEATELHRLEP
ncbi:MAG: hypothetical protein DMD54_17775, partial [Gemmatimonadetes bacterium]